MQAIRSIQQESILSKNEEGHKTQKKTFYKRKYTDGHKSPGKTSSPYPQAK